MRWPKPKCIAVLYLAKKYRNVNSACETDDITKKLYADGATKKKLQAGFAAILADLNGRSGSRCSETQKQVNRDFGNWPISKLKDAAEKAMED